MLFRFIFSCVIYLGAGVLAEDEIKRGTYPFMAFIYYQDESVLGLSGNRFLQGAVLVRPSFLISSSPESTISHDPLSKTLLARLGATVIDPKFTLNEDEDEQEQEVIQITRPYEHDSSKWWLTDICLLKTLQPIVTTTSVRFTQLSTKHEPLDKVCHILVFKQKSGTDVRLLTRLFVEMLPASGVTCGEKFVPKIMTCASDQPSNDDTPLSSDFCRGNNGGPLICDDDVIALQTYINGDCKAPHLYQLLSPRKRFLDCGIDEKCDKEQCLKVCSVIQKDASGTATHSSSETTPMVSSEVSLEPASIELTTLMEAVSITTERVESEESGSLPTSTSFPSTTTTSPAVTTPTPTRPTSSWPNKVHGRKRNDDEEDALNRTVAVEAQRTGDDIPSPKAKSYKGGTGQLAVFHNLLFNSFLLCLYL